MLSMFFHLLFIHTFRPFLKYNPATSPLPANVSPRKLCTQAASMISKLLRLYKRSHGLRQICNIVVYITHSACTIHLLNLPEKNAKRDIVHGLKHLEEIAEGWLCARRTLGILGVLSKKWNVDLPEEGQTVLKRTYLKFGAYHGGDTSPRAMIQPSRSLDEATSPHQPAEMQDQSNNTDSDEKSYFYPNGSSNLESTRRTNSGVSLPPHSAQDMQHPPRQANAGSTASTSPGQPHGSVDSTTTLTTSMASPTDMFGGIEQLIREGHDWTLRDQQNLALGFDNWGSADWVDLGWTEGGALIPDMQSGGAYDLAGTGAGAGMATAGTNDVSRMAMMNSMDNLNGMNGVNGINGFRTDGYVDNEMDWYN